MADLDALIRVRRHTVEEKQKFLSALYREAELLEAKKREMEQRMESEKIIAQQDGSPESAANFMRYADNVRKKIAQLVENLKKMEGRIVAAQEDVRAAFAEKKKIEIIAERRAAEERAEIAAKEADTLDDIAIEGFRRKEDADDDLR